LAVLQLFDSSVLIPWLRSRRYDEVVTAALASRRFLLCTVVWMELYAGTRTRADKRDLDRMVAALSGNGAIEVREHANDVLIALSASRAGAELVTVNREDMERWQGMLKRSRRRLSLQVVEES